jgi:Uncharacterized protein conserved in bacteria
MAKIAVLPPLRRRCHLEHLYFEIVLTPLRGSGGNHFPQRVPRAEPLAAGGKLKDKLLQASSVRWRKANIQCGGGFWSRQARSPLLPISLLKQLFSMRMQSTAAYAAFCASASPYPSAVTPSTLPPEDCTLPFTRRVPA